MSAKRWHMGTSDMVLVGELHCRECLRVTDVKMNGSEQERGPDISCPRCGTEKVYWVNEARDWGTRDCLFIVDEEVEPPVECWVSMNLSGIKAGRFYIIDEGLLVIQDEEAE